MQEPVYLDDPYRPDPRGRSAEASADEHIRDLIRSVLFTAPGERVNRPEFGCGLKQLVFMPNSDALAAATQQLVHGSLHRWLEDVISVERVDVQARESTLEVTVIYVRRDTSGREEAVFSELLPE